MSENRRQEVLDLATRIFVQNCTREALSNLNYGRDNPLNNIEGLVHGSMIAAEVFYEIVDQGWPHLPKK